MSVLLVIPARYASTRYPGKPLVEITGASGVAKSLIRRSWDAAMSVKGVDRVIVATDDKRIKDAAESFGAEVVMTPESCRNGTERCAAALTALGSGYDMVVNLQGDAPLTPAWFVEDLIAGLDANPDARVATPVLRTEGRALRGLRDDRAAGRVGGTTAVFGANHNALYFSKEVIPYTGQDHADDAQTPVFHHVGVYAYRPDALAAYTGWDAGPLEQLEGLEQLRFLERGVSMLCVEVQSNNRQFWELNNPEDLPKIEAMLVEMGQD
ncbi:3-deoxy-manno-octulosonate cytidylyltransferase [Yoonia sp. 208BN28-4]|uniref:3-deoxy-manno-octulosonate cytidylyltransferase n=1 Tax=Yoonia sp. 208BN28-4 TaxID=3126505 RepID=UPI0030A6308F